ncbi:hypothetical protein M409DRAFT_15850 [Zasmidium cellare ATCC 36951]|uniref:Uncharacterized protein n=1 Tax=Zasmidium cellare ATCC 36951 TaxID=1080233 RepID=A0A6A6D5T0_ZASCE|nr:uncharacterized protein M409DRAFT_15850 [Zasmidium cellare ATCC 36951]KAF2173572.1 hypothetical protein M409DRAFT_15850 [Zasmidium cellare ATCC 36951]
MSVTELTLESDMDAFWKSWDDQRARKEMEDTRMRAWQKSQGYVVDDEEDPKPTFSRKMQDSLPEELQFQEDQNLYPEFLPMDEKKLFPLARVYGGKHAYRGGDRCIFKKIGGQKFNVSKDMSALILVKDSGDDGKLVAFGHPYLLAQKSSDKDPSVPHDIETSGEEEPLTEEQEELSEEQEQSGEPVSADQDMSQVNAPREDMATEPVPEDFDTLEIDEKLDPRWLKVRFKPDSQRPCVSLSFFMDPSRKERKVILDIYAQHLQSSKDCAGITEDEIEVIQNKDPEQRYDAERLLVTLMRAGCFSIFTQFSSTEKTALSGFFKYFRTIMYAAAHLGNFWWYALAADGKRNALQEYGYPFDQVPVPRWMIPKWCIEYAGDESNAKPLAAHMQQCGRYNPVTEGGNKDPDFFTFGKRFAIPTKAQMAHPEFDKLYVTKSKVDDSAGPAPAEEKGQEKQPQASFPPERRGNPPGTGKRSQKPWAWAWAWLVVVVTGAGVVDSPLLDRHPWPSVSLSKLLLILRLWEWELCDCEEKDD